MNSAPIAQIATAAWACRGGAFLPAACSAAPVVCHLSRRAHTRAGRSLVVTLAAAGGQNNRKQQQQQQRPLAPESLTSLADDSSPHPLLLPMVGPDARDVYQRNMDRDDYKEEVRLPVLVVVGRG